MRGFLVKEKIFKDCTKKPSFMCFIIIAHAAASQKIKTRFYCNYSNWALNNTYTIKWHLYQCLGKILQIFILTSYGKLHTAILLYKIWFENVSVKNLNDLRWLEIFIELSFLVAKVSSEWSRNKSKCNNDIHIKLTFRPFSMLSLSLSLFWMSLSYEWKLC